MSQADRDNGSLAYSVQSRSRGYESIQGREMTKIVNQAQRVQRERRVLRAAVAWARVMESQPVGYQRATSQWTDEERLLYERVIAMQRGEH